MAGLLASLHVSCGRRSDVAAYVDTDSNTEPAAALEAEPPRTEPTSSSATTSVSAVDVTRDAGVMNRFSDEPLPSDFEDASVPWRGSTSPSASSDFEAEGGVFWISGWPLDEWTSSAVAWPLEESLDEFFGPPSVEPEFQIGVWVRGEKATVLDEWWEDIPEDEPGIEVFDGQRFVVTDDGVSGAYAVSAEFPPEGTESRLPIPNGM